MTCLNEVFGNRTVSGHDQREERHRDDEPDHDLGVSPTGEGVNLHRARIGHVVTHWYLLASLAVRHATAITFLGGYRLPVGGGEPQHRVVLVLSRGNPLAIGRRGLVFRYIDDFGRRPAAGATQSRVTPRTVPGYAKENRRDNHAQKNSHANPVNPMHPSLGRSNHHASRATSARMT
jgi:hypothetical protein